MKMSIRRTILTVCFIAIIQFAYGELTDEDLIKTIDNIDSSRTVYLFGGLSVVKVDNSESRSTENGRETLLGRAERYIRNHELQFDIPEEETLVEEARLGKIKKIVLPILLAIKLKFALILPLILSAITLVSLKGMAAGLLALMFSGVTLLRDLSKKTQHVTTAYISGHPVNAEIMHSDWHRNSQSLGQDLSYGYSTIPHAFD